MKAAVLKKQRSPLVIEEVCLPQIEPNQLRIKVEACGICRTDLHVLDGDLPLQKQNLILGHEIVGIVEQVGSSNSKYKIGDRVGVPWLAKTCGLCEFCKQSKENLCDHPVFTGYHIDGGFAEYAICFEDFVIALPSQGKAVDLAPLLCAGLIGYRSYKKIRSGKKIGIYGFGAAGHLLLQLAVQENHDVYVFTKPEDIQGQTFAKSLGAFWVGSSHQKCDELLDGVVIFAPVGSLVPQALQILKKGGSCVCGGIHMSNIPSFPYSDLWGEKEIVSVANLTRLDAEEYFELLKKHKVVPKTTTYTLDQVNEALDDLRSGRVTGAIVLTI